PKLSDEYVVFSAHWDHFGIGAPDKSGDTIYNGALDNASGVASVLEIARALSNLPAAEKPRRSILFLIPTAEEQGLLGSEWYSRHPLVPIAKTAANINLDSMNILGPTNDFVALGAERSSLNAVVWAIARERGNRISPDPRPEQGSFYRSDHFPFAKVGVPSISFNEGDDYIGRPKGWGEKKFGLTSQLRRAAVSIPANIAEGAARRSNKEFAHFLSNSQGSASEVETELLIAHRLNYCQHSHYQSLCSSLDEIGRMLTGLA